MSNTHQGLIITSKQKYTCPGKSCPLKRGSCYFVAFALLYRVFENCPCTAVEAPLCTCASKSLSSFRSFISHLLHGNIPVCVGKLRGFTGGEQSPLQNTNSPRNSLCMPFPIPLKGMPWHQHQKTWRQK